jgi:3-hydroxyisobutyrate dehydrogenase-like beta-hydroxyacid dehydrogenase
MSSSPSIGPATVRVAFCGLGRMGRPMARRIADAGYPLTVWNVRATSSENFAADSNAAVADSPRQAAAQANVVVTMLVNGPVLLETLKGPDGVLAGMVKGSVLVDCSTIGSAAAAEVRALCRQRGVEFVACPVSGSTSLAEQGQLGLIIGGTSEALDLALPVLRSFAKSVTRMESPEAAAATKVAINGLLHTFNTGLAEMVVITEEAGVSRESLFDALANSVLSNAYLDYKRSNYEDPEHAVVAFDLQTALKDITLAADVAEAAGVPDPLIGAVRDVHRSACEAGYGPQDMSALAEFLRQASHATTN